MIYLIGAGGHAKVVLELFESGRKEVGGFVDATPTTDVLFGYPVLSSVPPSNPASVEIIIAIGNNLIRRQVSLQYKDFTFASVVHPGSNVSKRTTIDHGTVVMAGVSINACSIIGKHVIINTNASVDHDCEIGDFVHLSPNCALAGNVIVGEGTHIGIGAAIIQGIKVGKWATVGAGAAIIEDVPDYAVVVGVPGKVIKFNK